MEIIIGILIPFMGTVFGSAMVFFLKSNLSKKIENVILGFAAGVMVSAAIWSLIIPSMEQIKMFKWVPVLVGLSLGMGLFYGIDFFLKRINFSEMEKVDNLMLAITIHNIPEGMAVGIAFASYLSGGLSLAVCYALAIGIAIQNFPEGSIVSLPLYKRGYSKRKAFMYGTISALFELVGAIITLFFTNIVSFFLPYLLNVAAGAMFYVVIVELIPESSNEYNTNVIGFLMGFLIMMILDITLG